MNRLIEIINLSSELPSPIRARHCDTFFCRLRGLMLRSHIEENEGLLLVQPRESRLDASIHMLFVFTDLAVIWINSQGIVVDTLLARAWHPAYFPVEPAKYILEISPSRLGEFHIGDEIKLK